MVDLNLERTDIDLSKSSYSCENKLDLALGSITSDYVNIALNKLTKAASLAVFSSVNSVSLDSLEG